MLEDLLVRDPNLQIVVAGPITPGDASAMTLKETIQYLHATYPGRVAALFEYISHSTALEIMCASTLFLMPSRFEPGGITQLEALAAGTLVVGRDVGGISATIDNYNTQTGIGTGFLCKDYKPTAFANTTHWAIETCSATHRYQALVEQAINARHSWTDRCPSFTAVLQRIILGASRFESLSLLKQSRDLCSRCQVQ